MRNQKTSTLTPISYYPYPYPFLDATPKNSFTLTHFPTTQRASLRKMKHQLALPPVLKKDLSTTQDELADFAQKSCLNEGVLKKTRDYVYLKLNKEYLEKIFAKIQETHPNVRMPSFHGHIGPHISIIRHDEWKGTPPQFISELGAKYLFTPVRIDVIQMSATKKLWVLVVQPSEELLSFRKQYAQGDLPHGHEFHITVAQESS